MDNRYNKSREFVRLEKLADLEKRILGHVVEAKADDSDDVYIPNCVQHILSLRAATPVPRHDLDSLIDDGLDTAISHLSEHNIMLTPGEALYGAIGRKDDNTYKSALDMKLSDILSLITNRAVVSQTKASVPMQLDDFDRPKYIQRMIILRGMGPDELGKIASNSLNGRDGLTSFEFVLRNGQTEKFGKQFVSANASNVQSLIDDGVIIKVIKLMSNGRKKTVYTKEASSDMNDILYLKMLEQQTMQSKDNE